MVAQVIFVGISPAAVPGNALLGLYEIDNVIGVLDTIYITNWSWLVITPTKGEITKAQQFYITRFGFIFFKHKHRYANACARQIA